MTAENFAEKILGYELPYHIRVLLDNMENPSVHTYNPHTYSKRVAACLMLRFYRHIGKNVAYLQPFPCWKSRRPTCMDEWDKSYKKWFPKVRVRYNA